MARADDKPLRAEHSEATRTSIVASARALFAERGYAGVSIEDIVRRSRVTRGALYHHFRDKRELFATVCEEVHREATERVLEQSELENDALEELVRGTGRFLDLCLDPEVRQIIIIDGSAVLGWDEHHAIEERYGLALLRAGLTLLAQQGRIPEDEVEPLANMLLGSVLEAGMDLGRAEDPHATRARYAAAFERVLRGTAS